MQKLINGAWFLPKKWLKIAALLLLLSGLCYCSPERKSIEEKPSNVVLHKVSLSDLPGWQKDNFAEVISAFAANCQAIEKNSNEFLYEAAIKIRTGDYKNICRAFKQKNISSAGAMKSFLQNNLVAYAVSADGEEKGKFTSYYEAVIHASLEKHGKYKYPIYGRPHDLVEVNLRDFDEQLPNTRLVGRVENGRFVPYYNRREIENNGIKAPVLMWGDDLVDIHFMHIQGSALAKLDDGSELRIGFADSNGKKFKGIGRILLDKKLIGAGEATMPKIREWLRKNPSKAADLMAENERYIFQRLSDADGPVGALGVALTAGRSLAVDNTYIPLGAIMWLSTKTPDNTDLNRLVFAQDIGSAIKGAVRGDYFWGHGEDALAEAGRMNSVGRYYLLVPKNAEVKVK